MRKIRNIVESAYAPTIDSLWLNSGDARYFSNGKWITLGASSKAIVNLAVDVDNLSKQLSDIPVATEDTAGVVKKGAEVPLILEDTDIATVAATLNSLIISLKTAGIIA